MNDDDDTPPHSRRTPPPRRRTDVRGVPAVEVHDERSDVYGDPLQRIETRQRRASNQIELVSRRVLEVETRQDGMSHEIRALAQMTQDLLRNAEEERRTRADRAEAARLEREAAEARKEREEARRARERSANRKLIAGIVVPTIAAIAAGIASVISAINSSTP